MTTKTPEAAAGASKANRPKRIHTVASEAAVCPASHLQRALLSGLNSQLATATYRKIWSLSGASRIHPGIDIGRAQRAFNKLVDRHDSLRMRFAHDGSAWNALIDKKHLTGIQVHDVGPIDNEPLLELINAAAEESFDLENGPLFQVHIFQCSPNGDIILMRFHHLIADSWSAIVAVEEFFQLIIGIPLFGRAPLSFAEYMQRYETAKPSNEQAVHQYWRDLLLPAVPRPKIGRLAKGLEPNWTTTNAAPTEKISTVVDAASNKRLIARAKSAGATFNNLVMAAYASTLMARAGADELYFNIYADNRTAPELRSFVGWHSPLVPVRCNAAGFKELDELAKAIHNQIQSSYARVHWSSALVGGEFDCLVNESGGFIRQFVCGSLVPEGLVRKGIIGTGFMAEDGEVVRAGSVTSENIALRCNIRTEVEMALRFRPRKDRFELELSYDMLAFTATEAEDILRETIERLAIDANEIDGIRKIGRFGAPEDLENLQATGSLKQVRRISADDSSILPSTGHKLT
jgi:hypothetical protein